MKILSLNQTQISDAGLGKLSGLSNLIWLTLAGTEITDAGMKNLSQLKKLRMLELQNTKICGSTLKELAGLQKLKSLFLHETKIDDSAMDQLAGLRQLKIMLSLSGTKVTDAGLLKLGVLSDLDTIIIGECPGISFDGIVRFKKLLPRCNVTGY